MVKCITRILQVPIQNLLFYTVWLIIIIHFFTYFGYYNFSNLTSDEIKTVLYKAINPKLKLDNEKLEECKYEILNNPESLNTWEVPKKFNNFSAEGIENGSFCPKTCRPLFSVALLVTYRNRQKQLDVFVPYMHQFLREQNIHYKYV